MGFFAGLDAEKYDRKYSDRYLARRISHYFRPDLKRLALIIFLIITISLVYTMLPVTVSRGVDLIQIKSKPVSQAAHPRYSDRHRDPGVECKLGDAPLVNPHHCGRTG